MTLFRRNNKVWQCQSIVESFSRDKTENDIIQKFKNLEIFKSYESLKSSKNLKCE